MYGSSLPADLAPLYERLTEIELHILQLDHYDDLKDPDLDEVEAHGPDWLTIIEIHWKDLREAAGGAIRFVQENGPALAEMTDWDAVGELRGTLCRLVDYGPKTLDRVVERAEAGEWLIEPEAKNRFLLHWNRLRNQASCGRFREVGETASGELIVGRNDDRDEWLYHEIKGNPGESLPAIHRRMVAKISDDGLDWLEFGGENIPKSMKRAANNWAEKKGLARLPSRMRGRKPKSSSSA